MAKVTYISITPGLENQYYNGIRVIDRFEYSRVGIKNTLLSKKSKKGISQRSLLPELSVLWAALSESEKTAWNNAGAVCNKTGWRLFLQDTAARRANDLTGLATPSLLHQAFVGNIHIVAPATETKIIQTHPSFYYTYKKVTGKKAMYNPVGVNEFISLPLKIGLNYSSNLSAAGAGSFAKFYAKIWYSYQGVNRFSYLEIPLDLITDWKSAEATLSVLDSIIIRYDLFIHLYNLQGDLYFDNIIAEHGGVNYARDQFCNNIDQGFTKAFYQIPKHWSAEILPAGAIIESIYKDF